jgi:hypothetical protein
MLPKRFDNPGYSAMPKRYHSVEQAQPTALRNPLTGKAAAGSGVLDGAPFATDSSIHPVSGAHLAGVGYMPVVAANRDARATVPPINSARIMEATPAIHPKYLNVAGFSGAAITVMAAIVAVVAFLVWRNA